jgi:hypothetical protein
VTEHAFPSIKILTTNGTGDRVVVGFLVAFSVVCPLKFFSPSVEPNILPEDRETRILYLRHWNTIRTEEVTGNRVQDRYNFTLHDMTASTFPEIVRRIFRQQTTAFWCQDVVGEYTLTCHVGSTPLETSPSLLLFWWSVEHQKIWSYSGWSGKQPRSNSPQSSNSPSVEPNILPEDPETRILYLRHWNTIRTEEVTGNRDQDRYNSKNLHGFSCGGWDCASP